MKRKKILEALEAGHELVIDMQAFLTDWESTGHIIGLEPHPNDQDMWILKHYTPAGEYRKLLIESSQVLRVETRPCECCGQSVPVPASWGG